jgi:hypothetical protein
MPARELLGAELRPICIGDRVAWITTAGDTWSGTVVRVRGSRVTVSHIWSSAGENPPAGRTGNIAASRLRPAVTMHDVRLPAR